MYGTPLPNVNGVHRPCTLGRLVKCRPRRMGFDPRAPFSLANHAQCVATASAPRFFNPTVFSFPFAYDARTWGSHPRRISFVAEVVVAGAEAETPWNLLDDVLIEKAAGALESGTPVTINQTINNRNRSVGAMLSNEVSNATSPHIRGLEAPCMYTGLDA